MKTGALFFLVFFFVSLSLKAETEPNNSIAEANPLTLGGTGSGSLSGSDSEDWFVVNLPQGGIFNLVITKTGAGNGTVYLYDGEKSGNPEIINTGLQYGDSPAGGWTLSHALLDGRYYIRVRKYGDPVNYQITTSLTLPSFAEDREPDDSLKQALAMPVSGTVSGTLHYYDAGTGKDMRDWYKVVVPQAGILTMKIHKKGSGNTTLYLRDENTTPGKSLSSYYLHYDLSPAEGYSWSFPVMAGNFWILAEGGDGVVDYRIESSLILPPWAEDNEPNDSMKYAMDFPLNDSVSGIVYYYKPGTGHDETDWYVIHTPEYGQLSFDVSKKGIYGVAKLRDSSKDLILQSFASGDLDYSLSKIVPAGTYYLVFYHSSNWLQYKAGMTFIPKPSAEFSAIRTGNAITFENSSAYGETYSWDFDDGTQSTAVNPFHEYAKPGDYDVCLIAKNVVGSDTACHRHIIPGIDRFFPAEGGNSGDVTVQIFGGGLDTNYTATIRQGSADIASSNLTVPSGKGSIQVRFDLRGKPVGTYDMLIEKPGGPSCLIPGSFKIAQGTKADPWVKISGRNRILFNTWTTYTVNFGNNGNVDAVVTPVWLAFSKNPGLDVQLSGLKFFNPDSTLILSITNETFIDVDSLFGVPGSFRIYSLLCPVLPANYNGSFNIRLKTDQDLKIFSWTEKPWFQSPINKNKDECVSIMVGDILDFMIPDLQKRNMIFECFKENFERLLVAFLREYERDVRRELILNPTSNVDIKTLFWGTFTMSISYVLLYCKREYNTKITDSEIGKIKEWLIKNYVNLDTYALFGQFKSGMLQMSAPDCKPELAPVHINHTPVKAVNSRDPNEKSGPAGFGEENYIALTKEFPYTIFFENKSSATAPAHTITITDQLDTAKLDLSSFGFGDIQIGDSTLRLNSGLKEFVLDKKLDKQNVVARISGKLDVNTGKLEWKFRSLDPVTLDDTEDPDTGLLPPDVISPEGQGSVSFFVRLKNDPVHKGTVTNQASIVFDANPAIITNEHLTTFDLKAPQSTVQSLAATTATRQFTVKWGGTDDGSGIEGFNIYVKSDTGSYRPWLAGTTETSAVYQSPADGTFQFASVAFDKAGNREILTELPDASTRVLTSEEELELPGKETGVFPSLMNGELTLRIASSGRFTFRMYGTDGRIIMEKEIPGGSVTTLRPGFLSQGLYLWELVNKNGAIRKSGRLVSR